MQATAHETKAQTNRNAPKERSERQLAALNKRGHVVANNVGSGVRRDRAWARSGAAVIRSNPDLLDAVEWMVTRAGQAMTPADARTLDELRVRAFGVGELSRLRMRSIPSWLADQLPRRRATGYAFALAGFIAAFRAGACGVWMTYSDAQGVFGVGSSSTWRKWTAEMENLGLIRVINTYTADPVDPRKRILGASLYVLGEALAQHPATLEGVAHGRGALDAKLAGIAERKAQRLRDRERVAGLHSSRAPHCDPRRCGAPTWPEFAKGELQPDEHDGRHDGADARSGSDAPSRASDVLANKSASRVEPATVLVVPVRHPLKRGDKCSANAPRTGGRGITALASGGAGRKGQSQATAPAASQLKPAHTPAPRSEIVAAQTVSPARKAVDSPVSATRNRETGNATALGQTPRDNRQHPATALPANTNDGSHRPNGPAPYRPTAAILAALEQRSRGGFGKPEADPSFFCARKQQQPSVILDSQRQKYSQDDVLRVKEALSQAPAVDFAGLESLSELERLWLKLGADDRTFARQTSRTVEQARAIIRAWKLRS